MMIGENLYDMINDSFECDYHFTKIHEYPPDKDLDKGYPVYLNPYSVYSIHEIDNSENNSMGRYAFTNYKLVSYFFFFRLHK